MQVMHTRLMPGAGASLGGPGPRPAFFYYPAALRRSRLVQHALPPLPGASSMCCVLCPAWRPLALPALSAPPARPASPSLAGTVLHQPRLGKWPSKSARSARCGLGGAFAAAALAQTQTGEAEDGHRLSPAAVPRARSRRRPQADALRVATTPLTQRDRRAALSRPPTLPAAVRARRRVLRRAQ